MPPAGWPPAGPSGTSSSDAPSLAHGGGEAVAMASSPRSVYTFVRTQDTDY